MQATDETEKSSTKLGHKPKGTTLISMKKNNIEMHIGLTTDQRSPSDWVKGSALDAADKLASSLQD